MFNFSISVRTGDTVAWQWLLRRPLYDSSFSSFPRHNAHENGCSFKLELKSLLYAQNQKFSWILIRWKIFVINFFFKILTRKCNYLCSHLKVRLGEANRIITLFFYFFHIYVSGHSTQPIHPLDLIWWLTFQVSNQWNSINLAIEISKHSTPLRFKSELGWAAFLASGTPQQWILEKKNLKK